MAKRTAATTKKASMPAGRRDTTRQVSQLRVVVIGAGGVGLSLLPTLGRVLNYGPTTYQFDVADLSLVDGNSFEERHRDRQRFAKTGNKAEVTVKELRDQFRSVTFTAHGFYLTKDNISGVVKDEHIVFCCVDNHATRKLVSEHCETLENVTVISGGNELTDGNIQIFIRRNGENVTAPLTEFHKEIQEPKDENPADAQQREGCDAMELSRPATADYELQRSGADAQRFPQLSDRGVGQVR